MKIQILGSPCRVRAILGLSCILLWVDNEVNKIQILDITSIIYF